MDVIGHDHEEPNQHVVVGRALRERGEFLMDVRVR
jgi:hypothetical protein